VIAAKWLHRIAASWHRRRRALCVAAGLALAGLVWAAIAVTGLAALFELVPPLHSTHALARGYRALRRPIDRACGALLVAFGLRLVASRG
jgi:threonine/homoserine/homoserine lactone efflux protein